MSPLYNSQILSKNPHHWFMKKTNMEQWRGQCIIVPECTALIILSASTICFGWGVGFFMGSSGHNTMSWKGFLLGMKEHYLPWPMITTLSRTPTSGPEYVGKEKEIILKLSNKGGNFWQATQSSHILFRLVTLNSCFLF